MKFIDLAIQQKLVKDRIDESIRKVLAHGMYVQGPEVEEIEKTLAKYVGVDYAISCASGTDALLLSLMAHGVSVGDRIITTPFTFIATAEVISLVGAIPIFVDVDPRTFNIDPEQVELAVKRTNAKGVIAVNIFGVPADYDSLRTITEKYRMFLIEDAAQSFGAEYKGARSGSLGDVSCTSFFPSKPLGCYGDGGMCFTKDYSLAEELRLLRNHGEKTKYHHFVVGLCSRLDTIQAAILKAKFEVFCAEILLRQDVATTYVRELWGSSYTTQFIESGYTSAWAQFSVVVNRSREEVLREMSSRFIPYAIYYPVPLHKQVAFSKLSSHTISLPVTEKLCDSILSIPMHPYLTIPDQMEVVNTLKSVGGVNE